MRNRCILKVEPNNRLGVVVKKREDSRVTVRWVVESFVEFARIRFAGKSQDWDVLSLICLLQIQEEMLNRKSDLLIWNSEEMYGWRCEFESRSIKMGLKSWD